MNEINFSTTLEIVKECFEEEPISSQLMPKLESITIIRDVTGKINLFLERSSESSVSDIEEIEISDLDNILRQRLDSYYGNDVWLASNERDAYKALTDVIRSERVSAVWDNSESIPRWYILERHIAKQAWTSQTKNNPPWSQLLVEQGHKPAIVTFFSFKGGVGRTTTLVSTALTLARLGLRVVVVDFDLEAPGLASILTSEIPNSPGVIDYLIEKRIQGSNWLLRTHLSNINNQILLGDQGETLKVLSAGTVDETYLEKLARLDFQQISSGELPSMIEEMLKELERETRTIDFILIDSRAGFHDIGGLAITNFSHAVVLFGTQSRQSWDGLTHVIRHLTGSLEERLPIVLIHAMAPALGIPGRNRELEEFRDRAYLVFQENYYSENETVPNSNDPDAPFSPIVLPYQDSLRGDIALFSRNSTTEESSRLSDLVTIMTDRPYLDVAEKLRLIFGRVS